MKTEHLGNIILVFVLMTALAGMYVVLKPTGRAIELPTAEVTALANCCCGSQNDVFTVPAGATFQEATPAMCESACAERSTTRHPVSFLAIC